MITYASDNIFKSSAQTLVNPVNTVGAMGAGLARIFKNFHPEMYEEYRRLCQTGSFNIGDLYIYHIPDLDEIIINFPTKEHWRNPSRIAYIIAGLKRFVEIYQEHSISSVSFPQLGCGAGGLDWEGQIKPTMELFLGDLPIPVFIHLYNAGRPND